MTDQPTDDDVIALLLRQHQEIRSLFTELETATGDARRDAFRSLVRLLAVHETAEEEEREEFPRLRTEYSADQLRGMAVAVRAAEAVAPTRPHGGTESAKANLLLGPPAAIMDRARDLIRGALRR